MDPRTKSEIYKVLGGGIVEESTPLPEPIGLDWEHRTDCKPGQRVSAIVYIPNRPEIIINAAINNPEEILSGRLPMGVLKVLGAFQDDKEAKDFSRAMLDDNIFREVVTIEIGAWRALVPRSVAEDKSIKDVIDAKGREIVYAEKLRIRNREANYRREAAKKMAIINQYDKDIENPNHIMKYVHLRQKKNYVGSAFLEAKSKFLEAANILEKTINQLDTLEQEHPEFKDNWKAALQKFCEDTGEDNPYDDGLNKVIDDTNREAIGKQIDSINKMAQTLNIS